MIRTLVIALCVSLQGCAALDFPDYRDRPWDPRPGSQLFEQIPNWDNEAQKVCGRRRQGC